jgi:segregation and condensation protein B
MELPLRQIIESIIFIAEKPVKADFLLEILTGQKQTAHTEDPEEAEETLPETETAPTVPADLPEDAVSIAAIETALEELIQKYSDDVYPFEIRKVARGYQFFTKEAYYPWLRKASIHRNRKRLTRAALETVSIIAYRQPITKAEVEFIRGVNCDYAVQKLLEKQLITIIGRSDGPGRPLLYGTSDFFMEYFGISDVADLPKLKEFEDTAEQHMELFRQHQEDPSAKTARTKGEDETEKEDTESETLLGTEGDATGTGWPGVRSPAEEE